MSVGARTDHEPPIRALFVNGNLGGHVTLHQNLARVLDSRSDVAPRFLDVPRPGFLRQVVATRVPGLARFDLDFKQLRYQLAVGASVALKLARRAKAFDVVHVYPHDVGLLAFAMLRRVPTVVALDAPNSESFLLLPYRRPTAWTQWILRPSMRLERKLFASATLVVAQSTWAANALVEHYGLDPGRIRVIRYGILPLTAPAASSPAQHALPQITFVGRTMDRKGGTRLLRVFRDRLSTHAELNLVTQEPVHPEHGVRVVNDIVPGDERLAALLAETAVFALPSDTDMSPYSILEAMALGVPVVASAVGGIAEMVEHGVTGLVVPPNDDEALASALLLLVRRPDLRERMGQAAASRFHELFDARATTDHLVGVLREAIQLFSTPKGRIRRGRDRN